MFLKTDRRNYWGGRWRDATLLLACVYVGEMRAASRWCGAVGLRVARIETGTQALP